MLRFALIVLSAPLAAAASGGSTCLGLSADTMAAGQGSLPAGVSGKCITFGGLSRCWLQYVPTTVTGAVPLMVSLHGGMSCAEYRLAYDKATAQGMVVVWPNGAGMTWAAAGGIVASSWNADGECCGPQSINNKVDDIGFVKQVIDNVVANVKSPVTIDPLKIYMTGHSMGCMLANNFLTKHSDYIAAMTCTGHTLGKTTKNMPAASSVTPTSVMLIHGFLDTDIPFMGRGGPAPPPAPGALAWGPGYPYEMPTVAGSATLMSTMMGCTTPAGQASSTPPAGAVSFEVNAAGCPAGVEVKFVAAMACGHETYYDMPVSTASDKAAGVKPCKYETTKAQYAFLSGKASAKAPTFGAAVPETTYPTSNGALIGGIVGGCSVPVLMLILWMSGVFAPKCPSPLKKTPQETPVTMTNIDQKKAGGAA